MLKNEFDGIVRDYSITMLIGLLIGTGIALLSIGYEILKPISAFGLLWIVFSIIWMINSRIIKNQYLKE